MYKIEFIPTGHVFVLPDETAKDLKSKFPEDYKIIEKNGKKFRDKISHKTSDENKKSIRKKVVEEEKWKRYKIF